jgi:hypothetical protein
LEEKQKFIKMVQKEGYTTYKITKEFVIQNNSIKNCLYSSEIGLSSHLPLYFKRAIKNRSSFFIVYFF